jgi:tetratricopeptide (TPR) repeat protein
MFLIIIIIVVVIILFYFLNNPRQESSPARQGLSAEYKWDYTTAIEYVLNKAQIEYDKGNFENAIAYLNAGINVDPKNFMLWNKRGNANFELEKIQEAINDYSKSIEIEPDFAINNEGHKKLENALNYSLVNRFLKNNSIDDVYL